MGPAKRSGVRTLFRDITSSDSIDANNIDNGGDMVNSSPQAPSTDPKERRRERDRERYAQIDKQKKDQLLQRRRETRQQKQAAATLDNQAHQGSISCQDSQMGHSMHPQLDNMTTVEEEGDAAWNDENIDQDLDSAWLHRDDSYQRQPIHDPGEYQQCVIADPKEKKRQRDRGRYARLSSDKKAALLKRRREDYQDKKMSSSGAVIIH